MGSVTNFLLYASALLLSLCSLSSPVFSCANPSVQATELSYRIIDKKSHSRHFYTQGLLIHQGILHESTGGYGESALYKINHQQAEIQSTHRLSKRYFGEGLTLLGDKLYQLTWREQTGFVYDVQTLEHRGTFTYQGEGWGLTNNGSELIMSNGSSSLIFLDPIDFSVQKRLQICEGDRPVEKLNELEWIRGQIYANIWFSNTVVIIDPISGQVVAKVDLTQLLPSVERLENTDVLNGIAYDHNTQALWVTGKRWPWLYHIELRDKRGSSLIEDIGNGLPETPPHLKQKKIK